MEKIPDTAANNQYAIHEQRNADEEPGWKFRLHAYSSPSPSLQKRRFTATKKTATTWPKRGAMIDGYSRLVEMAVTPLDPDRLSPAWLLALVM